jgi:TetR/AcrR family transcriptional regulator
MGIAERKEREKQQRVDAILDATETVFARKGLHGATMEDVAKAAELGTSTLYLYFKCKEHLYFALDLRGSRIQKKRFEDAVAGGADGLSQVMAIARAYLNHAVEHPVYFYAKTQSGRIDPKLVTSSANDPFAIEYNQTLMAVQRILLDALNRGIADGSISPAINPMIAALALWSQSNGVIEVILNRGEVLRAIHGIEPLAIYEHFLDSIRKSLAAAAIAG